MTSEAQKRANQRYKERTRVQFNMDLNRETEFDIIEWLECQDSKRGAVKELIRKAIRETAQSIDQFSQ